MKNAALHIPNTLTESSLPASMNLPFVPHQFSLMFDGQSYSFLRPRNPDEVLDSIPEELYEKDRFLPYWAEQWPTSNILLSFLSSQNIPPECSVIELGCGLGIISTIAGLRAHTVIAADISFDALLFAQKNIQMNCSRSLPCLLDWRKLPFKATFDLIIASDVLYEARWIDPILECCKQLLSPRGRVWIADPCRSFWKDFKKRSEELDFDCKIVHKEQDSDSKNEFEILELKRISYRK